MRKSLLDKALAIFLLSGASTFAGTFTADFSNPNNTPGYYLNQVSDTTGNSYPAIANNELEFTPNEASIGNVSIVVNDIDNGAAIDSFTATFQLQIGPGSSPPADGFALAFGPDISQQLTWNEEGPPMPSGGVCVCFVSYPGDGPGIGVNVRVFDDASALGGIVLGGYVPMAASTMVDSQMHPVSIQVNRNGTLNMVWNGKTVYTNLYLGGWAPTQGQFGIGGRTGGDSQEVIISNLVINTHLNPATTVAPTVPNPPQSVTVNEGSSATFSLGFDGDAPITLQWLENGTALMNATNPVLTLTQVSYTLNNAAIACKVSNASG